MEIRSIVVSLFKVILAMQEKKAVQFANGDVVVLPKGDAIQHLIDGGRKVDIIGTVCGKECNTECFFYVNETCPAYQMRDMFGALIRVFPRAAIVPPAYW